MIREMADVKTQYITKVVNIMRRIYREKWEQYQKSSRALSHVDIKQNSKYF